MAASTHPLRVSHRPAPGAAYDAVIVGGGPAALGAALVLGRARLRALVVDSGRPANARSPQVGGLLGGLRTTPEELRREGRDQLAAYPSVDITDGEVQSIGRAPGGFAIRLAGGAAPVRAHAVLLAHGLRYEHPDVPGLAELWGTSALHCPFCDGWEVRDLPVAVLGSGAAGARLARTVAARWSTEVVLCSDGPDGLADERAGLERAGVRVRDERVRALVGRSGQLERIEFDAGPAEERDAIFVRPAISQPNDFAEQLGCRLRDDGTILVEDGGRTGVPGVYAAGDAATPSVRSVALAIGSGTRVGASLVLDLTAQAAA
jgi:thioredoxin reductase